MPDRGLSDKAWSCVSCGGALVAVLVDVHDTRFGVVGRFDIAGCASCGLEQTLPRPTPDQLTALYEEHYNFGGSRDESRYGRLRQAFLTSAAYRLFLAIDGDVSFHGVAAARPGVRLLDYGCNEGRGLELYRANGFAVEGLEPNRVAAERARARGFTVHNAGLAEFRPREPYDVVVLSNVLEHALDPGEMLAQVGRLLAPGGEAWVSCPNGESWLRRLFGRAWINWHVPFHVVHFSRATLERALDESGFAVTDARQATPALWVAQSVIAALFARPGRPTRQMRSPFLVIGLMLLARGLGFPLLWLANRLGRGDCLVWRARKV